MLVTAACCLKGGNVSIGIRRTDKKRQQNVVILTFALAEKWGGKKKTHRKRHFSFHTADMALQAKGGLKEKQSAQVAQPTPFIEGGPVKELLFESNQVEDGFPGMQHCKKILCSPYMYQDSYLH